MTKDTTHGRKHKQTKAIMNRLSRIEGHIRSIKAMVEEGRDCSDLLIQVSAVRSAVDKVGRAILEDHLESCLFQVGILPEGNDVWGGVKEALDVFL